MFVHTRKWLPDPARAFDLLVGSIDWAQLDIKMFGKLIPVPRLIAAFGDAPYTYSGITHNPAHNPERWPTLIGTIRNRLEAETGVRFNTCLANYYRTGHDSISWHSDDEPELGPDPTIASVSLGGTRTFAVKSKTPAFADRFSFVLESGDLLMMNGSSQRDYVHSIPKVADASPRINLTFRVVNS